MRYVAKAMMIPVGSIIGAIIFIILGCITTIDYLADSGKA
jgi:hypothetical protein